MNNVDPVLTPKEVAEDLRCSISQVYRLMNGDVEGVTVLPHQHRFYKIKELIDQYANFFSRRSDFRPKQVIELGIFDGGSTAFYKVDRLQ